VAEKNELLFSYGINFNDLPNWQKRGVGLYWKKENKVGHNPLTGKDTNTERNVIFVDYDLPMRDEYSDFIKSKLDSEARAHGV
jgi:tRNA(His) 5'-end guanylyltransferase